MDDFWKEPSALIGLSIAGMGIVALVIYVATYMVPLVLDPDGTIERAHERAAARTPITAAEHRAAVLEVAAADGTITPDERAILDSLRPAP